MKKKNFNYLWMLLCLSVFSSCKDEENFENEFIKEQTYSQPTEDNDVTTFSGQVTLFVGNDEMVGYLQKRFPKIDAELTDETSLVLINEEHAKNFMNNADSYEQLKRYWYRNRVVAFVKPANHALALLMKLQDRELDSATEAAMVETFGRYLIYAAKADGTDYSYNKLVDSEEIDVENIRISEDKNGQTSESITNAKQLLENKFSDFNKGQVAEAVVEWLKNNAGNKESRSDVAFVRSRGESMLSNPEAVTHTRERSITINYTLPWDVSHLDSDEGEPDAPITVKATHSASIIGVYDKTNNRDLYDIEFNQSLNASITTRDRLNQVTYTKSAYKWKYTAGVYTGPIVEGTIKCNNSNFKASAVKFIEPAPFNDPGKDEYTLTHNPATHTIGGSLMKSVGASVGTGGINIDGSYSASFSYSCTLPSTSKTEVYVAMKPVYSEGDGKASWDYRNLHGIYKATWGSNPKYNNPYGDICHSQCNTKQFVTYSIPNSRSLEKSSVSIGMKTTWSFYEESANPWGDTYARKNRYSQEVPITLPIVYRYFCEYRPECYYSSVGASQNNWTNISAWLMANQYYKDFSDENLSVGGRTKDEVTENANRMWDEALTSMAMQFKNGLGVTDEHYIISIYCSKDGERSAKGLYIHDDTVEIVDDVEAKKNEIKEKLAGN